ncbi:Myosin-4 [Cucumispora dikerogammari]|nr:Myosin-4 [Cucumispora dikerogammari]
MSTDQTPISDICRLPENTPEQILNYLKKRYDDKNIYSYAGSLLISINPYNMNLGELYSEESRLHFHNNINPAPHIYAIAERAFNYTFRKECTIIVSGESGSGKTTCVEKVIEYLLKRTLSRLPTTTNCKKLMNQIPQSFSVGYSNKDTYSVLHKRILSLNHIFESFGNAKTEINDNSSRFGKLITLLFKDEQIKGAHITTYLLEKSRISHSNYNFNIFYDFLSHFKITYRNRYIDSSVKISNNFTTLLKNLEIFEIDPKRVLYSLTAIIFLGDIEFIETTFGLSFKETFKNATSTTVQVDEVYNAFTSNEKIPFYEKLMFIGNTLNLTVEDLQNLFFKKIYNICGDVLSKKNSKIEADKIRDTLVKNIYTELFDYIIKMMNKMLNIDSDRSISILDIYGFENFEKNCFEQFCINWANERIQTEFIKDFYQNQQKILKEQGLMENEDTTIGTNSTLELIETDIVDLITEESIIKTGTLGIKIENAIIRKSRGPITHTDPTTMKIKHFAGPVIYNLKEFIEKNNESNNVGFNLNRKLKGHTVLEFFKASLNDLFAHISKTKVFYIKCIRPSSNKTNEFNDNIIIPQLKATGLIHLFDFCKTGYFQNIEINEFNNRYEFLNTGPQKKNEIERLYINNMQRGKTSYFLKRALFERLEKERRLFIEAVKSLSRVFKIEVRKMEDRVFLVEQAAKCNYTLCETRNKIKDNCEKRMLKHETVICEKLPSPLLYPMIIEKTIVENKQGDVFNHEKMNLKKTTEKTTVEFIESKIHLNQIEESHKSEFEKKSLLNHQEKPNMLKNDAVLLKKVHKNAKTSRFIEKTDEKFDKTKNFLIETSDQSTEKENIYLDEIRAFQNNAKMFDNKKSFIKIIKETVTATPIKMNMKREEVFFLSNFFIEKCKQFSNNKKKLHLIYSLFPHSLKEVIETNDYNINSYLLILTNIINFQQLTNTSTNFGNYLFCEILDAVKVEINSLLPEALFEMDTSPAFSKSLFSILNKKNKNTELVKVLANFFNLMKLNKLPINFILEGINHLLQQINYKTFNDIVTLKNISVIHYKTFNLNLNEIFKFLHHIDYPEGILNLSHLRELLKILIRVKTKSFHSLNDFMVLNSVQLKTLSAKMNVNFSIPKDNQLSLFVSEPVINFPKISQFDHEKNDKSNLRPYFINKKAWKSFFCGPVFY